jgi:oligopeptide transport system permease protein
LSSFLAPLVAPSRYDVANIAETLAPPSARHWLGADAIGRDEFSRILYGGRTSLEIAFAVIGLSFAVAVPVGLLVGFRGGATDYAMLRLIEISTALPTILFAMLMISILGNGMGNVILALAATAWIEPCRLMRAEALTLRHRDYVEAARALGATTVRVLGRHLLPTAIGPMIVVATTTVPKIVFAEAGLSYLGLGISDPLPSWGKMVGDSVGYLQAYPALGIAPAIMIAVTVLSFTLVGDGLRDVLDPTSRLRR